MNRILVVGGTGMLRSCVMSLARDTGTCVTVLARHAIDEPGIDSIVCDYTKSGSLLSSMERIVAVNGCFDRAVLWVHSNAPGALEIISPFVSGDILRVLGSKTAVPKIDSRERTVILGWADSAGGSRWLTHEEISDGVLQAFGSTRPRSVVGRLGSDGPGS